ncbi:choline transport protein [Aspergillus ibericus CBS 121593]|uniref:Choline transport protein n=1 Tax=Aspergillus ibericus CBS 121593 TaxID=1448316 RepID=A0A395H7L8_9EURO|nr:choline transport protein [Aspergillus ibericus CBS 121593]RAL03503.1 choline transport protein [Aspergillus ibericus CBS 121593]
MQESVELRDRQWDSKGASSSQSRVHDEQGLGRVGKKQILKRRFGFLSILGFSCTILASWEGALSTFTISFEDELRSGGPAGTVYSFLVVWLGTFSTFVTLSELVSMAPTSGGQYHWVSMMAPRWCQKYISFLTGWLIVIGWLGAFTSTCYLSASEIQGLVVLNHASYVAEPWQAVLLFWAIVAFAVFVNVVASTMLPKFEGFVLILHLVGFFAIIIPLLYLGEHNPASEVFGQFANEGGFPTQGLSFMVGMVGNMFAFTGADAAVHMSEEIHDAERVVPQSILTSVLINGLLGFGMTLSTLFTMTNSTAALESPTGYPYMQIFCSATKSMGGCTVMSAIVPILVTATAVGSLASSSRMVWSFARDRGLPGWRFLSKVSLFPPPFLPGASCVNAQAVPQYSILVVTVAAVLLALIILGSAAVLNDVVSLCVSALYTSYLFSAFLLMWKRCTGGIREPSDTPSDTIVNTPGAPLSWGPFRIRGALGIVVNGFSIAYLTIGVFFSFWPDEMNPTASTMNWAVVGTVGTSLISTVYYVLWAQKEYTGPVVEIDRYG